MNTSRAPSGSRRPGPGTLLLAALLLAAQGALPQEGARVLSLDDSVRLALLNDPELQKTEQGITIARQQVREATFLFLPDIGLQASATRFHARYPFALRPAFRSVLLFPSSQDNLYSGQAYLTMPLYDGGRTFNTLRLAQAGLKQAQSKYDAVKLDILYHTKRVFYALLLAQQRAEDLSALVSAKETLAPRSEEERLERRALELELRAEEADARHTLAASRLEYLREMNLELDAEVQVAGALETRAVDVDLRKALVWAAELRPELQSHTYKAQMDAIAVNLSLGRRNPTLVLGFDYELTGQEFPLRQNNWDATVGIRIPFSLDYWTQHTVKLAEQRQGEIARAQMSDKVQLEVRQACADLSHWQEEWLRRDGESREFQERLLGYRRENGSLPVRLALYGLRAKERALKAVMEHLLAIARLERAVGRALPQ